MLAAVSELETCREALVSASRCWLPLADSDSCFSCFSCFSCCSSLCALVCALVSPSSLPLARSVCLFSVASCSSSRVSIPLEASTRSSASSVFTSTLACSGACFSGGPFSPSRSAACWSAPSLAASVFTTASLPPVFSSTAAPAADAATDSLACCCWCSLPSLFSVLSNFSLSLSVFPSSSFSVLSVFFSLSLFVFPSSCCSFSFSSFSCLSWSATLC